MEKDIRYKILKEFKNMSTGETIANKFLSEQHSDLGSILRALSEMIDNDYLVFSGKKKESALEILNIIDTRTINKPGYQTPDDKLKKSPQRFNENITLSDGTVFNKIEPIRLYTTFKGIQFLIEYERFKKEPYMRYVYILIGVIFTSIATYINDQSKQESQCIHTECCHNAID